MESRGSPAGYASPAALSLRAEVAPRDRKSTRLNSSHANISYAVFCLKKNHYRRISIEHVYHVVGLSQDAIDNPFAFVLSIAHAPVTYLRRRQDIRKKSGYQATFMPHH